MTPAWTHVLAQSCPWPERRGLRCRIVTGIGYPFSTRGRGEVVVLVEDDPLTIRYEGSPALRGWSCVLSAADLEPLADTLPLDAEVQT